MVPGASESYKRRVWSETRLDRTSGGVVPFHDTKDLQNLFRGLTLSEDDLPGHNRKTHDLLSVALWRSDEGGAHLGQACAKIPAMVYAGKVFNESGHLLQGRALLELRRKQSLRLERRDLAP